MGKTKRRKEKNVVVKKIAKKTGNIISIDAMVAVFVFFSILAASYMLFNKQQQDVELLLQASDIVSLLAYNTTFNETAVNNTLNELLDVNSNNLNIALNVSMQNGSFFEINTVPNTTNEIVSGELVFVTSSNEFGKIKFWAWRP